MKFIAAACGGAAGLGAFGSVDRRVHDGFRVVWRDDTRPRHFRFRRGVHHRITASDAVTGEVYHVARNAVGGADYTPVARVFAWRPGYVEGFNAHWRIDCFVRVHPRSPEPKVIGPAVAEALLREGLCTEPLWVSWHRSEELRGKSYGEVIESE